MNEEAKPHYHIRWDSGATDWERHETKFEAEQAAKRLVLTGEQFTIEKLYELCPFCKKIGRRQGQ